LSESTLTTRQQLRAIVDLEVARLHAKTLLGQGLEKIEIIELATLIRALGLDEPEDADDADDGGESDAELLALAESG
jgi:hypothetical protein